MRKRFSPGTVLSMMALTAAVTFVITLSVSRRTFNRKITEVDRMAENYTRLNELDAKVREHFYREVPEEDVTDGLLDGYVRGLGDRYSTYRSARELSDYEESNAGVYTGIGISVQQDESGDVVIMDVTEGGSAAEAGITAGDLLIEVEGISVRENYREAINLIDGEVGTTVKIRIQKQDSGQQQNLSLRRVQIDEVTVRGLMLENKIGYIRIAKFRSVTAPQFESARQQLLKEGAKGFIFDVRANGGGVLSALEQLADPLLPEGDLAFSTDKDGNSTPILHSDANCEKMPYIVLVDGNTASASELFACLLRDYADAKLVGEKTFGKGIMQSTFDLTNGGVTLTVATYETGITPCYHEIGLEPDILSVFDPESEEDVQLKAAQEAMLDMLKTQDAA
ncbi:MAG: PDZ domain-containing protein [Oscillospiraceae bacterium]|nr:PDZ domain-containing protein [Oscillospiraceae bacterium]MCR4760216.1 PDZ domain-containing protein [Oscillospiraceae bacterium]